MTDRKTSFELMDEARELVHSIEYDPDTGEVSDEAWTEWEATVEAWAGDAADKLLALEAVVTRLQSEEGLHKGQRDMHARRVRVVSAAAGRCKGLARALLLAQEELTGDHKMQLSDGRSAFLRRTAYVVVTDKSALPDELIRRQVSEAPDKAAIARRLKAGEAVPGAELAHSTSMSWSR